MKIKNLFIGILSFVVFATFTFESNAQKRRQTTKSNQVTTKAVKPSSADRRKTVENLLLEGKYQHDGSGELAYIGTMESVPALLKVLEDNPPYLQEVEPEFISNVEKEEIRTLSEKPTPKPIKTYICTYAHAVFALQKITGQKFVDYEDWKNWWIEKQKNKEATK